MRTNPDVIDTRSMEQDEHVTQIYGEPEQLEGEDFTDALVVAVVILVALALLGAAWGVL